MKVPSLGPIQHTSRRFFLRTSAAAMVAGTVVGTGLGAPALAKTKKPAEPLPIPGGSPVLGGAFHVYGPGAPGLDPPDSEPATVTDFRGFVGLAYISGTVVRTQRSTGDTATLPFLFSDMRFMQGIYRGADRKVRQGTFGFIWIDVYEPGPGNQINDFNPGIAPSGLFWTTAIFPDDVDVDFEEGSASMRVRNVAVLDFHDIGNALFGGGAPPAPAIVSFLVRWSGVQERVRIRNVDQDFRGKFIRNQAQMEWSATTEEFTFASAPANTSSSVFAELGHMRNGSFFADE